MITLTPILVLFIVCVALTFYLRRERLVTFWLLCSGFIHLVMETSYGLFPDMVKARASTTFTEFLRSPAPFLCWFDPHWWAAAYAQYARYDARYVEHDPLVIFFCFTEIIFGPLCFLLVWLIQKGSPYRHRLQLILCMAQFYGTVLYFVMPIMQGNWSSIMTNDPIELWVGVIGLNALWIIIPALMIIQSLRQPAGARV